MKNLFLRFNLIVLVLTFSSFITLKSQTNQYLNFDGTNDYVSVPNASSLVAGASAISMTGWFFDNNVNYGQGMMGFRGTGSTFYMITVNNGKIEDRIVTSTGLTYEPNVPTGTLIPNMWQHFAFVYDGTTAYFYLNGTLVASVAASGTFTTTANVPFIIGYSPCSVAPNFYYNGSIDEVTLWNKALTAAEIQGIMTTEPTGTEANLLLYYKFNQGVPAGNNTSITTLHNEVAANSPLYDGVLNNFALTGATSNFNGTLNTHFQAISFPQIPTKLITDAPFALHATSTSGLTVGYTVLSGPVTLSNDSIITITGAGTVSIKAFQYGNAQYDTATPIINTFQVVDPSLNIPIIEVRHPLAGNVHMPVLSEIQLAAVASINYPGLFSIQDLYFKINGTNIPAHDFGNGHYTAWWKPPTYGNYTVEIFATNNYGAITSTSVNIHVVAATADTTVQAFSGVLINSNEASIIVDGNLPSFIGAFDTIIATLSVTCPTGGCGAWDHTASIEAKSHEGNWFEIIRYITPYATACSHKINLGDYMSILNGKVTLRVSCATSDNGYLYALSLNFKSGTPPHTYSQVNKIWQSSYDFGNYANQQPVPVIDYTYPANVVDSKLKLISTGHMGPNNTDNAAEFYDATHHIYINNVNTFTQHNWTTCNPNPDACQPQSGTWQYNRSGWCPGSIAKPFDYDMQPFIATGNISLKYVLQESYIDQCNPNYPPCDNSICSACSDGANPFLVVACNLVNFFDTIPPQPIIQSIAELNKDFGIKVYPNPSNGMFNLASDNLKGGLLSVVILNSMGQALKQFEWKGENKMLNLKDLSKGVYFMSFNNKDIHEVKKIVVN
jgi:hypothetical protein